MDQRTAPKPQLLTILTLYTETTPNNYEIFQAKWYRYRNNSQKPHNHNAAGIVLKLWDCCPKNIQSILRSNGIDNTSMETELLTKMKAVTVMAQNVLINVNNFLCMRQQKDESIRLYLGRLKGAA